MATRASILSRLAALMLPDSSNNVALLQSPPQFDASTLLASTEFVQRAQGNFQEQYHIATDTTLTEAQTGGFIYLGTPGDYTITLPDPSTPNLVFTIRAANGLPSTIVTPSGLIYAANRTDTIYVLVVGAAIQIVSDGTNWVIFNGVTAQQPQFDESPNLANTAFVKKFGLSASALTTLTADEALTADRMGSAVLFSNVNPMIQTLPQRSTTPNGSVIHLGNYGAGAVTVNAFAGDLINANTGGAAISTLVLQRGDDATFMSNADNAWALVGGSYLTKQSSIFGAFLNIQGYQKLPSGVIVQWGTAVVTSNTGGFATDVLLPITFPAVHAACYVQFGGIAPPTTVSSLAASNASLTNVRLTAVSTSPTVAVFWFAIGW